MDYYTRYVILKSLNQDSKSSLNHHNTEVGPDEYAIIVSGFAPYVAFDCEVFSNSHSVEYKLCHSLMEFHLKFDSRTLD